MNIGKAHLPTLLMFCGLLGVVWAECEERRKTDAGDHSRAFVRAFYRNQNSQAGKEIERAVGLCPNNAQYLAQKALWLSVTNGVNCRSKECLSMEVKPINHIPQGVYEAIGLYQQAVKLNPNDGGFHHNLGRLYVYVGRRREAIEHLRKAVVVDGGVAIYHISVGMLLERAGDFAEAVKEYAEALRLTPRIADSEFFRDLAQRRPDWADKVVRMVFQNLEEGEEGRNDIFTKARIGKLYLYTGNYEKAKTLLRESVTQLPGLSYAWMNLGDVQRITGDKHETLQCYERAKYLDYNNSLAWAKLGDLYYEEEKMQEAITHYKTAAIIGENPNSDHWHKSQVLYLKSPGVADDMIPRGLLKYCNPSLDAREIYRRLAALFWETGNESAARYYESQVVSMN